MSARFPTRLRQWSRNRVPLMFTRRLLMLTVVAILMAAAMAAQLTWLTLSEGVQRRKQTEAKLLRSRLIPTARGRILDRRGRVLAEDKLSHDVSVDYSVLTGQWAYRQARAHAKTLNQDRWSEVTSYGRETLIAKQLPRYEEQIAQMWQLLSDLSGVNIGQLHKRRRSIIDWVQREASAVYAERRRRARLETDKPVPWASVVGPIVSQVAKHPVLIDVDGLTQTRIASFIHQSERDPDQAVWNQVEIVASNKRFYSPKCEQASLVIDRSSLPGTLRDEMSIEVKVDGIGLHIVGAMRRIWQEDIEGWPDITQDELRSYRPGDRTGWWGIEKSVERLLRGTRGREIRHLDTGEIERLEPVPGSDVRLSIDIQLQAKIQAMMDPNNSDIGLMQTQPWHFNEVPEDMIGQPLNGAAVVLDIVHGHVLAAVSVPTFTRRQLEEEPNRVWKDLLNTPFVNRTVARAYQPGSSVKPLVLAAGVTDGKLAEHSGIKCTGYLDPPGNPEQYRCWVYKLGNGQVHNLIDGVEAIARSCNIFFFTMGKRIGTRNLVQWYWQYGLGHTTGCGLDAEIDGDLPDLTGASSNVSGFDVHDGIFMGIGQGPVRWTPMQAAAAYAILARGGLSVSPTFLMNGDVRREQVNCNLNLNRRGVEMALQGMRNSVNESHGTSHHIRFEGGDQQRVFNITDIAPHLTVYGKSGTADAVPLRQSIDDNDDGYPDRWGEILRSGDHAWFVGLVKQSDSLHPDYVIVVVVEYAGSGGRVAGPIANQIMHAMYTEGYF